MTVFPTISACDARSASEFPDSSSNLAEPAAVPEAARALRPARTDTLWAWQGSRLVALGMRDETDFVGETCGASALEYTVIVALIIASLHLGIEFLARPAVTTFAKAADMKINGRGASPRGDASLSPLEDSDLDAPGNRVPDPSPSPLLFTIVVLCLSLLLLGSMIWRQWQSTAEIPPPEAPPEVTHPNVFDKRQMIARLVSVHLEELVNRGMTVGHVMSKLLKPVHVNTPREEVEAAMQELRVRHILVVDSDDRLCGIISDRDLHRRRRKTAGEMMTHHPVFLTPDSPLSPAITQLIQRQISCMPVVEDGRPIGVLTTTDVMMTLQCMLQELEKLAEKERKAQARLRPKAPSSEETASPMLA